MRFLVPSPITLLEAIKAIVRHEEFTMKVLSILTKVILFAILMLVRFAINPVPVGAGNSTNTPTYRIPCIIESNGNWAVIRGQRTDQQLLDEINNVGRFAHDGKAALDINNNTANTGPRTYGICKNLTAISAREGTVTFNGDCAVNPNMCTGGGNEVHIHHADGQRSVYSHLAQPSPLIVGQWYPEGQIIGTMGSTGIATGIHLHFHVVIPSQNWVQTSNWIFKSPVNMTNQPPNAPNPISPTNESITQNATISLHWQDTGDVDNAPNPFRKYFVEIWKTDDSWRTTSGDWIDPTSWTVTVPQPGTYKWQVKAGDGEADSSWSTPWHITYDCAAACPQGGYTFIGHTGTIAMSAITGTKVDVSVQVKNTGSIPWDSNTMLAPRPRTSAHPLYDPATWLSPQRIARTNSVQPGQVMNVAFALRAPALPGTYRLEFDIGQEGAAWFPAPASAVVFELVVQPPSAATTPLNLYWSDQRVDNMSAANPESQYAALQTAYVQERTEGYLFPDARPGTMPLKLFWNETASDHLTAVTPATEAHALANGYGVVRIEGYVYIEQQPGTVPLRLYWSAERHDYLTVASEAGIASATEYIFVGIEGYVYPTHLQGLSLYYNGYRADNFSLAAPQSETDVLVTGYSFVRIEGYLLPTQQAGTIPLKAYWHGDRQDHMIVASPESESAAINSDYTLVRIEGYIFATHQPGTVPLNIFWNADRQDHITVSTPQGMASAREAGYGFLRTEGYVYPAHIATQVFMPLVIR
jgi:hypothetical protein